MCSMAAARQSNECGYNLTNSVLMTSRVPMSYLSPTYSTCRLEVH